MADIRMPAGQAIAPVEDEALLLRGKFKAKAGRRFAIRTVVFSAVQAAFRNNGIRAVPKPMPISDERAGA
jgi:hypothetical protein